MLEARGVTVRYGHKTVLVEADLKVRPGELVALCGPNGAGKSTLLAAMAGDRKPVAGEILIDGAIAGALSAADLAARRAVLEQSPTLSAPFTVSELLSLGIGRHVSPQRSARIIKKALGAVGLAERAEDRCTVLSGGQRHRAHLARVLVQLAASEREHRYLMLDEPTASLDMAHQISTMRIASGVARAGNGVLVVLHDLNLAAAFADRVVLMQDGYINAEGPASEVFTAERLSAIYETEITVDTDDAGRPRIAPVYDTAEETAASFI